jgi:hypothetical protein
LDERRHRKIEKRGAIWQPAELVIVLHCLLGVAPDVDLVSGRLDHALDLIAAKADVPVRVTIHHLVSHHLPHNRRPQLQVLGRELVNAEPHVFGDVGLLMAVLSLDDADFGRGFRGRRLVGVGVLNILRGRG